MLKLSGEVRARSGPGQGTRGTVDMQMCIIHSRLEPQMEQMEGGSKAEPWGLPAARAWVERVHPGELKWPSVGDSTGTGFI